MPYPPKLRALRGIPSNRAFLHKAFKALSAIDVQIRIISKETSCHKIKGEKKVRNRLLTASTFSMLLVCVLGMSFNLGFVPESLCNTDIHDVAIVDVTPSTNKTYVGRPVNINVTVQNNGNVSDTFHVTAYYGNATAYYLIANLSISLDAGKNGTLTFVWDTAGVRPCQNYTIKANCTLLGDENPGDNEKVDGEVHVTILADINHDGVVNVQDLVLVKKAIGSYPGHPRWNPDADLDDNKKIDVIDVILTKKNIGKACT